jgi:hypothetical protein
MSNKCWNCPNAPPKFDSSSSKTFKATGKRNDIQYGLGACSGPIVRDQVCVTEKDCFQNFSFMNADTQEDMDDEETSGLVGLSPYQARDGSDLFVLKMKDSGAIDEAVFSLSIGMKDVQSKITFGGYDLD